MRKRLFEIIELSDGNDRLSRLYDWFMMFVIITSLFPLAFKETNALFSAVDYISAGIFVIDYVLRFITADYKLGAMRKKAFIVYPFTPMAIIDLLAILPSFSIVASGFRILKIFRLMRTFRVFRVFKFVRYSKSIAIISNVMKKQKEPLIAVCVLAAAYIVICALIFFNVESDAFENFFAAVYWATISLTTMGYGDIYPVSTIGRIVTMLSSFVGIAIVALPTGIITAGYMEEIRKEAEREDGK